MTTTKCMFDNVKFAIVMYIKSKITVSFCHQDYGSMMLTALMQLLMYCNVGLDVR